MTKTTADYYDALHSEEANRIRNAIYSALEDYVRYFDSQGFQIRRDWIDEAFSAATSLKWVRGGGPKEEPAQELKGGDEAIINAVRTILANGDTEAKAALERVLYSNPSSSSTAASALA